MLLSIKNLISKLVIRASQRRRPGRPIILVLLDSFFPYYCLIVILVDFLQRLTFKIYCISPLRMICGSKTHIQTNQTEFV